MSHLILSHSSLIPLPFILLSLSMSFAYSQRLTQLEEERDELIRQQAELSQQHAQIIKALR